MTFFQLGPHPPTGGDDFQDYLNGLYAEFCDQIVEANLKLPPSNRGLSLRRNPEIDGRHNIFWHLVSGGSGKDSERRVEPERCKRIHWLRVILDEFNARYPGEAFTPIRWWVSDQARSRYDRYIIATNDFSYIVIVEDRPKYVLLVTAYFVEVTRRREKFKKECAKYWENK